MLFIIIYLGKITMNTTIISLLLWSGFQNFYKNSRVPNINNPIILTRGFVSDKHHLIIEENNKILKKLEELKPHDCIKGLIDAKMLDPQLVKKLIKELDDAKQNSTESTKKKSFF